MPWEWGGAVVVFKFPHPADVYLNILPALLLFAGLLRVIIASTTGVDSVTVSLFLFLSDLTIRYYCETSRLVYTGALVSKGHDPSHPSS